VVQEYEVELYYRWCCDSDNRYHHCCNCGSTNKEITAHVPVSGFFCHGGTQNVVLWATKCFTFLYQIIQLNTQINLNYNTIYETKFD